MGKRAPEQTEQGGQIPEWQPLLEGGAVQQHSASDPLFSDAQWLNNQKSFQCLRQTWVRHSRLKILPNGFSAGILCRGKPQIFKIWL